MPLLANTPVNVTGSGKFFRNDQLVPAANLAYHDNFHQQPRYIPLSQPMPLLANTPVNVTGSGKFFRNDQLVPAANLGVVKVDSDGAGYHILWGLTNEAVPTSELPAHFLSH